MSRMVGLFFGRPDLVKRRSYYPNNTAAFDLYGTRGSRIIQMLKVPSRLHMFCVTSLPSIQDGRV